MVRPRNHVLIAEDDDGIRSLLVAVAERAGFTCHLAEDGREAIELIFGGGVEPDVILLDLVMPGVDGFTVLSRLSAQAPHLLARVIVLTAAGEARLRGCKEIERVWCVRRKPLEIEELRQQMASCAASAQMRRGNAGGRGADERL